jgi:hypothetical protein
MVILYYITVIKINNLWIDLLDKMNSLKEYRIGLTDDFS